MKRAKWWKLSTIVSSILIIVLVSIWHQMNDYEPKECQEPSACQHDRKYLEGASLKLVDDAAVTQFLHENWNNRGDLHEIPLIKVKTGIFIQSLSFFGSSDFNVTGYIWQRYRDGLHDHIKPARGEVGFILPEQVNSGSNINPREVYRTRSADEEIIGWYFESTLRQPSDYSAFPFDHRTASVQIRHKQFTRNIVLVPDFEAYTSTGFTDIFGIEQSMVLGSWNREDTFFDYNLSTIDTNFGIPDYVRLQGFPELRYNFVLKRKFENVFIVHLLPLFFVTILLFTLLLTTSNNKDIPNQRGFNALGSIGICSVLSFVVMLAHIQLRGQFAGMEIVYIEYFYILMYALLVAVAVNGYLLSIESKKWFRWVLYEDNLIFKLAYWPVLLICLILISLRFV